MNKKKREKLFEAVRYIDTAFNLVSSVLDAEEDSLSNMPENLEGSDRYTAMEDAIDNMNDAIGELETAKDALESASKSVLDAAD